LKESFLLDSRSKVIVVTVAHSHERVAGAIQGQPQKTNTEPFTNCGQALGPAPTKFRLPDQKR